MSNYYISPSVEQYIDLYVYVIFTISFSISAITLYCLIKVRKSLQPTMRAYFIYIQVIVTLNELHQDILFHGVPLFPQYAAYCKGILCDLHVPMTTSFGLVVLFICHVSLAIITSLMFRHQSILADGHRLKFDPRHRRIVMAIFFVCVSLPCISVCSMNIDSVEANRLIETLPYNFTWLQKRGDMYVIVKRTAMMESACIFCLVLLLCATVSVAAILLHITILMRSENRSKAATKRTRKSFANFSFQLSVPYLLIIIPASVIMLGLYSDKIVAFEVCLALYYIMHLHTLVHSLMVLGLTPSYRKFLLDKCRSAGGKTNHRVKSIS